VAPDKSDAVGGSLGAETAAVQAPPGFCNRGESEVWVYRGSRVRSPPVPGVLSVYQRGSLLDGLAVYLSCDTKKFHDNDSKHILHNFWTSTHRGEASPFPTPGGATAETARTNPVYQDATLENWLRTCPAFKIEANCFRVTALSLSLFIPLPFQSSYRICPDNPSDWALSKRLACDNFV